MDELRMMFVLRLRFAPVSLYSCVLHVGMVLAALYLLAGVPSAQGEETEPQTYPLLAPQEEIPPGIERLPDVDLFVPDPSIKIEGPPVTPPKKIWEASVEFGMAGSDGNTQNFNFQIGATGKRTTEATRLNMSLKYMRAQADGQQTNNRGLFDGREELLIPESRWSLYIHNTTEYDEFRAFDLRLTGDLGLGYQFIKNDMTSLIGHAGPGVTHELGSTDKDYVPEAVFNLAFEHKFSAKTKVTMTTDYFPDVRAWGDFRMNTQAALETLLEGIDNLSLKLTMLDRYDSTPQGKRPNDVDYGAVLIWKY